MINPIGMITTIEEIQNCNVLGLGVYLTDPDRQLIRSMSPRIVRINPEGYTLIDLEYKLGWFGIYDPYLSHDLDYQVGLRLFFEKKHADQYLRDILSGARRVDTTPNRDRNPAHRKESLDSSTHLSLSRRNEPR